jgi:hypothetical protein
MLHHYLFYCNDPYPWMPIVGSKLLAILSAVIASPWTTLELRFSVYSFTFVFCAESKWWRCTDSSSQVCTDLAAAAFQLLFNFYLEAKVHAEFFCCYFVELTFENRGDISFVGSETLDLYYFPILVWLCLNSKPLLWLRCNNGTWSLLNIVTKQTGRNGLCVWSCVVMYLFWTVLFYLAYLFSFWYRKVDFLSLVLVCYTYLYSISHYQVLFCCSLSRVYWQSACLHQFIVELINLAHRLDVHFRTGHASYMLRYQAAVCFHGFHHLRYFFFNFYLLVISSCSIYFCFVRSEIPFILKFCT